MVVVAEPETVSNEWAVCKKIKIKESLDSSSNASIKAGASGSRTDRQTDNRKALLRLSARCSWSLSPRHFLAARIGNGNHRTCFKLHRPPLWPADPDFPLLMDDNVHTNLVRTSPLQHHPSSPSALCRMPHLLPP